MRNFDPPMPVLQLVRGDLKINIAPGDSVDLGCGLWDIVDPNHPDWDIDNWPEAKDAKIV